MHSKSKTEIISKVERTSQIFYHLFKSLSRNMVILWALPSWVSAWRTFLGLAPLGEGSLKFFTDGLWTQAAALYAKNMKREGTPRLISEEAVSQPKYGNNSQDPGYLSLFPYNPASIFVLLWRQMDIPSLPSTFSSIFSH